MHESDSIKSQAAPGHFWHLHSEAKCEARVVSRIAVAYEGGSRKANRSATWARGDAGRGMPGAAGAVWGNLSTRARFLLARNRAMLPASSDSSWRRRNRGENRSSNQGFSRSGRPRQVRGVFGGDANRAAMRSSSRVVALAKICKESTPIDPQSAPADQIEISKCAFDGFCDKKSAWRSYFGAA